MADPTKPDRAAGGSPAPVAAGRDSIYPLTFSTQRDSPATGDYLRDPPLRKLAEFFEAKGLKALKDEDQTQQWYEDWITYQATHRIYASVLSPKEYSTLGNELDLLRVTRFLEAFAYFSPAHGYSLQVTFLGLFSILMGSNADLKREAVAALESGALFAFGVSEKNHGSDLLANEFTVAGAGPGRFIASGSKYYIGNANCASIIAILARKAGGGDPNNARRARPILFALRPRQSNAFENVRKIPTLGIRAAFVGEFHVHQLEFPESDLIAEGRQAWNAALGAVTLGKFFLGFGSIGICERALEESIAHLTQRVLYGKPVIEMPHIASAVAQAYTRLTAMKLYAYRALDYVHAARAADRRYLLFNSVQKAKVSTDGVKVLSLLSECIGAYGFESHTYFEMALRDAQLIPSLEGSAHINLGLTAQFIRKYFNDPDASLSEPESLAAGQCAPLENPYLTEADAGSVNAVTFPPYLNAYRPLWMADNVRRFARQATAFRVFARGRAFHAREKDTEISLAVGQCLAAIAYGQLVAENCARFDVPSQLISAIFHMLVNDLSVSALTLASSDRLSPVNRLLVRRLVVVPKTNRADRDFVFNRAKMT